MRKLTIDLATAEALLRGEIPATFLAEVEALRKAVDPVRFLTLAQMETIHRLTRHRETGEILYNSTLTREGAYIALTITPNDQPDLRYRYLLDLDGRIKP